MEDVGTLTPFSIEILEKIIEYAYYLYDPEQKSLNRTANLANLTMVNSVFHILCVKYSYRYCTFVRSNKFYSFLLTLIEFAKTNLGSFVHTLDFQEFTSVGLGSSSFVISQIQNLTERTILQCLRLTPNLRQFLSCESIEGDISPEIVDYLFNCLSKLECLDFCGSNGINFTRSFNSLEIPQFNYHLKRLSFHDCTDLNPETFRIILPKLPALERLDLTHTHVSASDLRSINANCRLTHLSIGECANIGPTRDLIHLLVKNPAINQDKLVWLNIENGFEVVKSEVITFLLENMHCTNLRYLNMNRFADVSQEHLKILLHRFPRLESLSISDVCLNTDVSILYSFPQLKYIDMSSYLSSSSTIYDFLRSCNNNITVVEVDVSMEDKMPSLFHLASGWWRMHNSNGQSRRIWIHRVESLEDAQLYANFYDNRIFFDIETGKQYDGEFKKPAFLKYASRKVNCMELTINEPDEDIFPNIFCERGLYRYYSLHR